MEQQYDLILDVVAHRSVFDYKRALRPDGSYYAVGGTVTGPNLDPGTVD